MKFCFLSIIGFLIAITCKSESIFNWQGRWKGSFTWVASDGTKTLNRVFLKFSSSGFNKLDGYIELYNEKDSLLEFIDNVPFPKNNNDFPLSQSLAIKSPDGSKTDGKITLKFNGTNLLKATGTFVSSKKNYLTANLQLDKIVGLPFLYSDYPINAATIKIDATELDDFQEGFAIIRKGENFAIIDEKGKFLIERGKYKFNKKNNYAIDNVKCGFINGMCAVRDPITEKYGFINSTGKLIISCYLSDVTPFEKDGFGWGIETKENGEKVEYYLNIKGQRFLVRKGFRKVEKNEPIYQIFNNGTEFFHKTGRLIFKTKRHVTGTYSNGLIRVDTTFELAGEKTGFIDTTNKLVIPFQSGKIDNFKNGFAVIKPATNDEFAYGFLDKKGIVQFKLKYTDDVNRITEPSSLRPTMFSWGSYFYINKEPVMLYILDSLLSRHFIVYPELDLKEARTYSGYDLSYFADDYSLLPNYLFDDIGENIESINFRAELFYLESSNFVSGGIGTPQKFLIGATKQMTGIGKYEPFGNKTIPIPPIFQHLGPTDLGYSNLTKAIFKNPTTREVFEGYINLNGYVMVKSADDN